MKRLLSILLMLSMLLCTVGALAEEQVTLRVGICADNYATDENGDDKLLAIFEDFTQQYPNIKVEMLYIPMNDWADYTTKVQAMFATDTAPDLIYCPGETENVFFENQMVLPMTAALEKHSEYLADYEAAVPEALRELTIHDGEYYGFVHLWENDVVWINNEVFRQASAEIPQGSWTWEEFETACDLIEKNTDAYAYMIPDTYYTNNGWLFGHGTGYLNDDYTAITFDSAESKELMQFYADSVQKGWTSADWTNLDFNAEFINGRTAMMTGGRWPLISLAKENFTDITVAYIPTKYSDRQSCAWASYQIVSSTKHYDEAALLAAWTGTYAYCNRFSTEVNSNIPSRSDVNTKENYLFEFDGMELFYEAYPNTVGMQNPKYFADLETIWRACVTSVISGEMDVEQAVNNAAAEMRMVSGL